MFDLMYLITCHNYYNRDVGCFIAFVFWFNTQDDTIRVIYSFTDTDPEDITGLDYHGGSNRGTRSVILLYYNDVAESLPDDVVSMDIVITEVSLNRYKMAQQRS